MKTYFLSVALLSVFDKDFSFFFSLFSLFDNFGFFDTGGVLSAKSSSVTRYYEPRQEKICLWGFQIKRQSGLRLTGL